MNLYADSSALLKLVLGESGSEDMEEIHSKAERLACVAVGYVELRAGLAMAARMGRADSASYPDYLIELHRLWQAIAEVPIDAKVLAEAGDAAETHALRAYDAIHLAALQAVGPPGSIAFACWDRNLRDAAANLGYELFPETV